MISMQHVDNPKGAERYCVHHSKHVYCSYARMRFLCKHMRIVHDYALTFLAPTGSSIPTG